jgi:ribonucleoside-triphosphate reductase
VIFQLQSLQQFGGVSATHLDWTMVPYVRKSFVKHYKDGWNFIEGKPWEDVDYEIDNMATNAIDYSIEDPEWKAYNHKVYDYAIAMTIKEVHQAVEGMYHNLNTL